jgi:pilus assembly protein CpaF
MAYPFGPFEPPGTVTSSRVNGNGHRRPQMAGGTEADDDRASEALVVRLIRRRVAARLTEETRAGGNAAVSDAEREQRIRVLITEALDDYATERMQSIPARPPLRPDVESRVARAVADSLLGAGGL